MCPVGRNAPGTVKPRLRKSERRRQLLNCAKQLFAELGYQQTTAEKVAEAAGVSEAVVRRHFDSKQAVILAMLQDIRQATLDRWQKATATSADPLVKIHTVADLFLNATREHIVDFRILHRTVLETDEEEVIALVRGFYLDSEVFLAQIIAEGQHTGVFRRSLDPRVGAWELIRTGIGYTMTQPLGIPLYAEPDHPARAIECLLHCLLKTDV